MPSWYEKIKSSFGGSALEKVVPRQKERPEKKELSPEIREGNIVELTPEKVKELTDAGLIQGFPSTKGEVEFVSGENLKVAFGHSVRLVKDNEVVKISESKEAELFSEYPDVMLSPEKLEPFYKIEITLRYADPEQLVENLKKAGLKAVVVMSVSNPDESYIVLEKPITDEQYKSLGVTSSAGNVPAEMDQNSRFGIVGKSF